MYDSLQHLTRYRFHTVGSMIRGKSYFLNLLLLKFNTFESADLSDVFGKSSLEVIFEFYSACEIVKLPLPELALFLKHQSGNRITIPDNLAEEIQHIEKNAYRSLPKMADSVDALLQITPDNNGNHSSAQEGYFANR